MQNSYSTLAKRLSGEESVQKGLNQTEALKRHLSLRLRTCAGNKCLIGGMLSHDDVIRTGHERDVYLSSLIVDLYGKCGTLYDAQSCFSMMQEREAFAWNCLISVYVRCMHNTKGLQCFEQMQQECIIPNSATFANVVAACADKDFLVRGMWLHTRSQHADLEGYVIVQTALISMYNKCGKLKDAQLVFEVTLEKDIVTWNAMLSAFVVQGDSGNAIQLFARMQMECVLLDRYTYSMVFSACSSEGALKMGKHLHACVLQSGFAIKDVMMLALVNMYCKCGSVSNARAVFDASSKQNLKIWNAVIAAISNEGNEKKVIQLFDRMLEEALMPDKVTFLSALASCASSGAAWQGRRLHFRLLAMQVKLDIQVETALVYMYGKLGSTIDAELVFKNMLEHDTVSWNAMISILSQHGLMNAAFQYFEQMQQEGLLPNKITLTTIFSGCMDSASLSLGNHLHALVVSSGPIKDICTGNALIKMYSKCGMLDDARQLFDTMVLRDIITWNSLLAGYGQNGNTQAALFVFNQMCAQGIVPDQATYSSVFTAIITEVPHVASFKGDRIFKRMPDRNVGVRTVEDIEVVEDGIQERMPTGAFLSHSILGSFKVGDAEEEAHFPQRGVAPPLSYTNLRMVEGMLLHCHILLNGLDKDEGVQKAVLRFYGKCGSLRDCESMFEKASKGDVITWNLMITVYILQGHDKEAIQLFDQMERGGPVLDNVSFLNVIDACANVASLLHGRRMHMKAICYGFDLDVAVGTALVTLYSKCGSLAEARWSFDHLLEQDVVAWTSMISTYVQFGCCEEALELFKEMQCEGVTPDVVSFTSALNASEVQSALFEGKLIHTSITQHHLELDFDVRTALIYMYGKCGSLIDAEFIFCQVEQPSLPLWHALIASYAQHGDGRKVFTLLFSLMRQGLIPNNMIFVSILSGCSRAGHVAEAYVCLSCAFKEIGFFPGVEHYDCMVDLLGRAGQFDEAEVLLKLMPFVPRVISWASLLATCHQVNTRRAELATTHLIEMEPVAPAAYVMLSNIYAAAEEPDYAGKFDQQNDSLLEARYGMSI